MARRPQDQKSDRKLPGLHELLTPGAPHGLPAAPNAFGPVSPATPRPSLDSTPGNSVYPPAWQPSGPSLTFPTPAVGGSDHSYHASKQVSSQPVRPEYARPRASAPQVAFRTPALSAAEVGLTSRLPQGELHTVTDDARRDSARPPTSHTAGSTECVGQQHFPGRGLCYVYRDGATCPTVIDGEVVNPLWGTTKAGKARKRLAQACLNCREKKIRCEPRHPRCLQCEKTNKECIMPSSSQSAAVEAQTLGFNTAALPISRLLQPQMSSSEATIATSNATKRRRSSEFLQPYIRHGGSHDEQLRRIAGLPLHSLAYQDSPGDSSTDLDPGGDARMTGLVSEEADTIQNPLDLNRDEALRLIDAFFSQKVLLYPYLYPRSTVRRWLSMVKRPRPHECMLLYCMISLAGLLLKDPSPFVRFCTENASRIAIQHFGVMTVWLAQARLLLTMVEKLRGRVREAFEYGHTAVHVVRYLRLYVERGCMVVEESERSTFGMNDEQIHESKRRTFWSCHVEDTLTGMYRGCLCTINNETIRVNSPAPEEDFVAGKPSNASLLCLATDLSVALFEPGRDASYRLNIMMIEMCRLMKQALAFSQASYSFEGGQYREEHKAYSTRMEHQLGLWYSVLPEQARLGSNEFLNMVYSTDGTLLVSCVAFYYLTKMHLARRSRFDCLDATSSIRSVRAAYNNAQHLLQISNYVRSYGQSLPEGQKLALVLPPAIAWPIFAAIDTVCAGGLLKDLRMLLGGVMSGLTVLQTLGHSWPLASLLHDIAGKRLGDLQTLLCGPSEQLPQNLRLVEQQAWRFEDALIGDFGIEHDILFEVTDAMLLQALRT